MRIAVKCSWRALGSLFACFEMNLNDVLYETTGFMLGAALAIPFTVNARPSLIPICLQHMPHLQPHLRPWYAAL